MIKLNITRFGGRGASSGKGLYSTASNSIISILDKDSKAIKEKLTKEQIDALESYVGAGSNEINSRMRGIETDDTYMYNGNTKAIDKDIAYIRDVLNNNKLKKSMMLFRGEYEDYSKYKKGDIIPVNSFISTSTSRDIALRRANRKGYGGTLIQIQASRNTNGLYMGDNFGSSNERETLLSDKYNYKYIRKTKTKGVNTIVVSLVEKKRR